MPDGLPFRLVDYLELVDWTGQQIREDKRGSIGMELPCILKRLDIDEDHWLYMTQNFESSFKTLVGAVHSLRVFNKTPMLANTHDRKIHLLNKD